MLMHLLRLHEIVIRFSKLSRFSKTIGTVKWELLIQKQIRVCVFYYSLNFIVEWYKVCVIVYFSCYLWRQSNSCRKQERKMQTASLCCRFRKNWRFQGKVILQLKLKKTVYHPDLMNFTPDRTESCRSHAM
jgi:hypothetical protein